MAYHEKRASPEAPEGKDAETGGKEVHQADNVGALPGCEPSARSLFVRVTKDVLQNRIREGHDDIDGGELMEDHSEHVDPARSDISLISHIGLLQSRLLSMIAVLLASQFTLNRPNNLLRQLLVPSRLKNPMDHFHSLGVLTSGHIEGWTVIADHGQEPKQDQSIKHKWEPEYKAPSLVTLHRLSVRVLRQD